MAWNTGWEWDEPPDILKFGLPAGCIGLVIGLVLAAITAHSFHMAWASNAWPAVAARITSVELVQSRGTQRQSSSGAIQGMTYRAAITYTYEVGGRRFQGDRVSFGDYGSTDSSRAMAMLEKYPRGSEVVVRYDPADPSSAVLEAGTAGGNWITLVMSAGFISISTVFLVAYARARRCKAEEEEFTWRSESLDGLIEAERRRAA